MKIAEIDTLINTDIKEFLDTTKQKTSKALPDIVPDDVKNHILSYSFDINDFMENDFVKRYASKKRSPIVMSHIMKKIQFISMATTIAMNFRVSCYFYEGNNPVTPYELIKLYVYWKASEYIDKTYMDAVVDVIIEDTTLDACLEDTTLDEQDI